eukprot:m51a1_g12987 putative ubiquitin-specific protease 6 (544) ;mRNA; r:789-2898
MARVVKVTIKWGKQKYDDVAVDLDQPPHAFKEHLSSLTSVPVDRQKVMIPKAGLLKDDSDWAKINLKDGAVLTLIGSAEVIERPAGAPTVFAEDVAPAPSAAAAASAAGEGGAVVEGVQGYRPGLKNLGNTCYMNATVQVLARACPEAQEPLAAEAAADRRSLAAALSELVAELKYGTQTVVPLRFLMQLRAEFPRFAEVDDAPSCPKGGSCKGCGSGAPRQQDAEECWSAVVSRMGRTSSLFEGELVTRLASAEAPNEPEWSERSTFRKLECRIDTATSFLIEGLQKGMVGEREKTATSLGRTAVFTEKSAITRLPTYLAVHFARFCWKKANVIAGAFKGGKAKIVKPVSFPAVLDVFSLCDEPLQKRLTRVRAADRAAEDAAAGLAPLAGTASATSDVDMEPMGTDTGNYELEGIVSHQGMSAEGGHYVAWVREAPGKWLKYDDDKVSLVGDAEIAKLDGHGGGDWHIAYLLLYRQKPSATQTAPAQQPAQAAAPVRAQDQPPQQQEAQGQCGGPCSGCPSSMGGTCNGCPGSANPDRAPH